MTKHTQGRRYQGGCTLWVKVSSLVFTKYRAENLGAELLVKANINLFTDGYLQLKKE